MTHILMFSLLVALSPELLQQNKDFWIEQLRNSSVDIRISALQKLGELRNPTSIAQIAKTLQDSNSEVRFHAIRALAKIPNDETRFELQSHLHLEEDPYLKSETRRSIKAVDEILQKLAEKEAEKLKKSP